LELRRSLNANGEYFDLPIGFFQDALLPNTDCKSTMVPSKRVRAVAEFANVESSAQFVETGQSLKYLLHPNLRDVHERSMDLVRCGQLPGDYVRFNFERRSWEINSKQFMGILWKRVLLPYTPTSDVFWYENAWVARKLSEANDSECTQVSEHEHTVFGAQKSFNKTEHPLPNFLHGVTPTGNYEVHCLDMQGATWVSHFTNLFAMKQDFPVDDVENKPFYTLYELSTAGLNYYREPSRASKERGSTPSKRGTDGSHKRASATP
jgi:hypothetical protein